MSTLIVVLPLEASPGPATPYDYVLSPDGRTDGPHARAAAQLLPAASGATGEVVAVVPVQALSWHRAELPKGLLRKSGLGGAQSPARVRSVLEGLLEDRLLDEPGELHFALAPNAREGAPVWVATCRRDWLRTALQPLEDTGHRVSRIVPELAPSLADEGATPALQVIGTPEHPLLAAMGTRGVTVLPLSSASLALLSVAQPGSDGAATPEVLAEPAVAAQAEEVLQRGVGLLPAAERWLQAAQSPWDLAQFDFANAGRTRLLKRLATQASELLSAPRWRPARWGLVVLLAANVLGLNAWAWKERAALGGKQESIRNALTTTFPSVRVIVDAPVQMERELALLRQGAGSASGRDLEAMLSALGSAAPQAPVPGGVEFSSGELRLRGLSLPDAQAPEVHARLRAQGYSARYEGDRLLVVPDTAPSGATPAGAAK